MNSENENIKDKYRNIFIGISFSLILITLGWFGYNAYFSVEYQKKNDISNIVNSKIDNLKTEIDAVEGRAIDLNSAADKIGNAVTQLGNDNSKPDLNFLDIGKKDNDSISSSEEYFIKRDLFENFIVPITNVLSAVGIYGNKDAKNQFVDSSNVELRQYNVDLNYLASDIISELQNDFIGEDPYFNFSMKSTAKYKFNLSKIKILFSEGQYDKLKLKFIAMLKSRQNQVTVLAKKLGNLVKSKKDENENLSRQYDDLTKLSRNKIIIVFAIPMFALTLLLIMVIPKFYPDASVRYIMFKEGVLLQIITIFLLIVTILLLGFGDYLSKEVIGTLLGGISVYVLQRAAEQYKVGTQNSSGSIDFDKSLKWIDINTTLSDLKMPIDSTQTVRIVDTITQRFPEYPKDKLAEIIKECSASGKSIQEILSCIKNKLYQS